MSLAFDRGADVDRVVPVLRAGIVARDICRRGGRGEIAAIFERSLYLGVGDDFVCIGEPAIGNGPTTLMIAARVAELGLRQGQTAFISNERLTIGDLLFDFRNCATWRAPPWPAASATLLATCAEIAQRAAAESPADSLARAVFGTVDTPLARLARPRIAKLESWLCAGWAKREARAHHPSSRTIVGGHGASRLSPPYGSVHDLVGLGPGLTPSGDDFLVGALAALDALAQTNMHAALGHAVVAAADRTSPMSASFLRAAAAGHIGENLHMMVAAIVTGDADAAVAAAARIGHTSGWDALAGAVVTARNASDYRC
jgi:Protein of unknown function (DUF2877)